MTLLTSLILAQQKVPPLPEAAERRVPANDGGFWMPPDYSNHVFPVDWPFHAITWVCIFFFVLIVGVMGYYMWRYNRSRGVMAEHDAATHNTPLEVTWSAIPLILVILMFYVGFKGYMDMVVAPENVYKIEVTAQKWNWTFTYPNGHSTNELHLPANENIQLVMKSMDVLHSLFIPDFRVKQDVVPGKFSFVWFRAKNKTNVAEAHWLFCTEYCGTGHSDMLAWVVVHPTRAAYEAWLAKDSDLGRYPPVVAGQLLYEKRGCVGCHNIESSANTIGPPLNETWKEVAAETRQFTDGSIINLQRDYGGLVENYIHESLTNPGKRIVRDYSNQMARQNLSEEEIGWIIAFLKWFSENDPPPLPKQKWEQEQAQQDTQGQ